MAKVRGGAGGGGAATGGEVGASADAGLMEAGSMSDPDPMISEAYWFGGLAERGATPPLNRFNFSEQGSNLAGINRGDRVVIRGRGMTSGRGGWETGPARVVSARGSGNDREVTVKPMGWARGRDITIKSQAPVGGRDRYLSSPQSFRPGGIDPAVSVWRVTGVK